MQKYKLLTKSDFDGLTLAAILRKHNIVQSVSFVHPQDVENGSVAVNENCVLANLPHKEEAYKNLHYTDVSLSRTVFNEIGNKEIYKDLSIVEALLNAVDKAHMANYTIEEVLNPKGYDMINFITDARTNLGKVRAFRISNYALMMNLIDELLEKSAGEILSLPDVEERVEYYEESKNDYVEMLEDNSTLDKGILKIDLRNETHLVPANRFVMFASNPECKIAAQILWGLNNQNTVIALGKNIFNRPDDLDLGQILRKYGGYGHANSGSIQVDNFKADKLFQALIAEVEEALSK